ncbi:hypothetical protein PCANC_17673 [Puccinia coronata f. sp. avenae]|uniref:Uncharacterized protein n=1 Tax=Puccinia coronata f. sp. avenae TaxID=200324 RepID=A0A2N5U964_9BASI|nr:hypothetical protein PCANC_17673 [Puccinia coronata f. sp. avenae]
MKLLVMLSSRFRAGGKRRRGGCRLSGKGDCSASISNGRGVDRPGFGGLQADVPNCHQCVTLVQFMDCRLMAGVDLWRAKLPKVAAKGGIGPPPPTLAASVEAPLEDNYTLRAAKVRSRSCDGSSIGERRASPRPSHP